MDILLLLLGFAILVVGGDVLVRGAVALSLRLGISAMIVAATVVAFGTSAPELLISVQAVIEESPGIAIGNVVGSNIANVLLVLGLPALLAPLAGCGTDAHRNLYFMLFATAVFTGLVMTGTIAWWGGLILVTLTAIMVVDSIRASMAAPDGDLANAEIAELEEVDPRMSGWRIAAMVIAGLICLPLGADLLVRGATGIARDIGVSEAVIGLTIVAIGTSLPELATTVTAALRNQADVAIGNVVGSNIFNITAIIGVASFVGPIPIPDEILTRDIWVMIAATLALTPVVLLCRSIGRVTGGIYLAAYVGYIAVAYLGSAGS